MSSQIEEGAAGFRCVSFSPMRRPERVAKLEITVVVDYTDTSNQYIRLGYANRVGVILSERPGFSDMAEEVQRIFNRTMSEPGNPSSDFGFARVCVKNFRSVFVP